MIFVDRTTVPEPPSLRQAFPDGTTEKDRAIAHYTDPHWDGSQYEFKRYKSDDVKDALQQLFKGKCAYCESSYGHIAPEDIEHWRPKGGVILEGGAKQKRGYYWLASTWSNLLPSCIHCNRKSRQEDARDPANEQSGKQNLFPVLDEGHRWTDYNQQNENGETPLLLNPCADHPEQFIGVTEEAVVFEKHPAPTLENRRAKESINVFGLNRRLLVNERLEHRKLIITWCQDIERGLRQLPEIANPDVRSDTRAGIQEKLDLLRTHRAETSRYLLMKIELIDGFLARTGPALAREGLV